MYKALYLWVGVLHLVPTLQPFPHLHRPARYEPNIFDMLESKAGGAARVAPGYQTWTYQVDDISVCDISVTSSEVDNNNPRY